MRTGEAEVGVIQLQQEMPRIVGNDQKLERDQEGFLPWGLQREPGLVTPSAV